MLGIVLNTVFAGLCCVSLLPEPLGVVLVAKKSSKALFFFGKGPAGIVLAGISNARSTEGVVTLD
jgi:hypothetical protein